MSLETLKNLKTVNGHEVVVMDDLRSQYPEKFTESGQMNWEWFEAEIRPNKFIYVRNDKNSISFTIQQGPIKEVGLNGAQVSDMIAVATHMLTELNKKVYSRENNIAITHLETAMLWLEARTKNRENRGVEGTSQL